VRNTNFLTAKGSLVREILYPSEFNFKFHHDSEKFILIGFFVSVVAIILVIPIMLNKDYKPLFILDCCLNMFTITVPPALPAALAVGTLFAI
jgi:magnesium-transporting ATPase (P-type)